VSELALDPEPAASVLPVRHAHLPAADLRGLGLHREGDVFLQGAQLPVRLRLERVGEHAAVRGGVQGGRR